MTPKGLLIAAGLCMIITTGCRAKLPEELIINKWHLSEMSGKDSQIIPDTIKAKMYNDATIEFKKEGKYDTKGMGLGIQKGTYRFVNGAKTLIMIDETGIPDSLVVVELTAEKLSLKVANADVRTIFKAH